MFKPFKYQYSLNNPMYTGLDFSTSINKLLPPNPVGVTYFRPIGQNYMPPAVNTAFNTVLENSDPGDQIYQDVIQLRNSVLGMNQQLLGETLTKSLTFCGNSSQNYQDISSVLLNLNFQPKHP